MSILVVDDEPKNIRLLDVFLLPLQLPIHKASNGLAALKILEENSVDLVLLDIMMPEMDGFEVCKRIRSNECTKDIPIIMLTSLNDDESQVKGFAAGANDFISKPFNLEILKSRVRAQLLLKKNSDKLKEFNFNLETMVRQRTKKLEKMQEVTILCMATVAEYRDFETGKHLLRTQIYIKELAIQLRNHPRFKAYLDDKTIEMLYLSAPLHDIGKVAIPDSILLKPSKFTDEEMTLMKKHTIYGEQIIQDTEKQLDGDSFLTFAREIAISHHEKWNGSGYPYGLKGEDIPISGRLMALVDVYDALVSKRVYKAALTHEAAVEIITGDRGIHFDPDVVDAFLEIQEWFKQISLGLLDRN